MESDDENTSIAGGTMASDLDEIVEEIILSDLNPDRTGYMTVLTAAYNHSRHEVGEVEAALKRLEGAGFLKNTGRRSNDDDQALFARTEQGFLARERLLHERGLRTKCLLEQVAHLPEHLVLAIAEGKAIWGRRPSMGGFVAASATVTEPELLVYLHQLLREDVHVAVERLLAEGLLKSPTTNSAAGV